MKAYLNTLNDREKWMVIFCFLCIFIYIYYLFLYVPLNNKVILKSTQLVEKIQTLEWMKKTRLKGHSSKAKKTVDNSQLLTLLATQLKEDETLNAPFHMQQTSSGEIQLTFDEVPFKPFVTWLAKIDSQYTMTIKQLNIEHTHTAGVTQLVITISSTP